ncbi:(deoxy)nucleoside triphosphate pyrophosphohydrolase [uncultured Pontibacter sp.]|uniref:(deoxy)nucleoside triphosphate pyrophosphohydrolase n=1 Tax=uncultured Pontibacter sp. TaxID=453356 RepID=UPI0026042C8E|nr:(deoxy)nucleoside triphosphate pyrophosphohydrolase [uncultured Pontibacter sp.]
MSAKEIKVLCGIIERHGLVLITQRSASMSQPLLWEFPGGKLEPGETEKDCLKREIKEELCINITPKLRLKSVRHTYPDKTVELIAYSCSFDSGCIVLLEHLKYAWVKPEDLLKYAWCPADVPLVHAYLQLQQSQNT